ncbi:hypothetical protein TWF970_005213 [Orbilia oligospora]|uniref:Uncharacterized protein n=1 Tax=Orbilia oligospora TaxID=2813651 RepID=A0A7C8R972_ORBOL|nr:hypothetical protein TWF970_005213 [Orbilia oligospora]
MDNQDSFLGDSVSGNGPSIFEHADDSPDTSFSDNSLPEVLILPTSPDNGKVPIPITILPVSGPKVKAEASISQSNASFSRQSVSQSLPMDPSTPAIAVNKVGLDGIHKNFAFAQGPFGPAMSSNPKASQTRTGMEPPPVPDKAQGPRANQTVSSSLPASEDVQKTNDDGLRSQSALEVAPSVLQDKPSPIVEARLDTSPTDMPTVVTKSTTAVKEEAESNSERPYKPKRSKPLPFGNIPVLNLVDLTEEAGETSQDEVPQAASPQGEQIGPRAREPLVVPAPDDRSRSSSVGVAATARTTPVVRPVLLPRTMSDDGLATNMFGGHTMSRLPRSRSAAAGSRGAGGAEINDIEIVHSILDDKFRRAQRLEDELAQMQDVIYDIDNKLGSIFDRDQEVGRLRDRCQRLQDALNEHRDRQASANEEVNGLRFKLQGAHDELKRIELNMAHQLARESDKLDLSKKINRQLRDLTEKMREGLGELEEDYRGLKAELAGVLEERDRLKSRIRERDREVEKMKGGIRECERALQEQREKYRAIHEQCIDADSVRLTNERLHTDLGRERGITASLGLTLKSMAVELEGLRCSLGEQHDAVTGGVGSTLAGLGQLLASQQEGFKEFRDGISKLQAACESPQSELFKSIDKVINTTDAKWTGVSEAMTSLQKQQETEARTYADKLEKWKGLKESLASQVQDLTGQLRDQQESIRVLMQEKHGFSVELERQKELNRCLVETTSKEKELNDLRLAEVSHRAELLEGTKREYLVRNSLLESTVRTLESKVEAEKKNTEAEKLALEDENKKSVEEILKLRGECTAARKSLEELDKVKDELGQATRLTTELEASIDEEQQKTKESNEELKALREQLRVKDEQLSLAASRWTDISVKVARLEEAASAARADAQLRAEEAQSHREKLNQKVLRVAELEAEHAAQASRLVNLTSELEGSKNELKEQSAKSKALQKAFDESETLCDDQGVEIEAKDNEITELEKLLDKSESKIKSLQAELSERTEEAKNLKAELEATNLERNKIQQTNKANQAEKADRTEKTKQTEKAKQTEKGKQIDKGKQADKRKQTDKGKQTERAVNAVKTGKTKESDKKDKGPKLHHAASHKIGKVSDLRRSNRVKSKTPSHLDVVAVNQGSTAGGKDDVEVSATQTSVATTESSVAASQPAAAPSQNLALSHSGPSHSGLSHPGPSHPAPSQNPVLGTILPAPSTIGTKRKPADDFHTDFPTDLLMDSGVTAWLKPTGREPKKRIRSEETLDINMKNSGIPASEESSQQDDLTYNAARHRNKRRLRNNK